MSLQRFGRKMLFLSELMTEFSCMNSLTKGEQLLIKDSFPSKNTSSCLMLNYFSGEWTGVVTVLFFLAVISLCCLECDRLECRVKCFLKSRTPVAVLVGLLKRKGSLSLDLIYANGLWFRLMLEWMRFSFWQWMLFCKSRLMALTGCWIVLFFLATIFLCVSLCCFKADSLVNRLSFWWNLNKVVSKQPLGLSFGTGFDWWSVFVSQLSYFLEL